MAYLFSEGPWKTQQTEDGMSVVSGLYTVAEVFSTPDEFYEEFTGPANLAVIGAAPEMYGLLEATEIAIGVKNEALREKLLKNIKERIRRLFLQLGVTVTQFRLKEIEQQRQEEALEKAKARLAKEDNYRDDDSKVEELLKKYFGEDWNKYELLCADIGFKAIQYDSEDDENFEEWYLFDTYGDSPIPYYFNEIAWGAEETEPAYVHPDYAGQMKVQRNGWTCDSYTYDEIVDRFIEEGVIQPDMDIVKELICGQSVAILIQDYIKKMESESKED